MAAPSYRGVARRLHALVTQPGPGQPYLATPNARRRPHAAASQHGGGQGTGPAARFPFRFARTALRLPAPRRPTVLSNSQLPPSAHPRCRPSGTPHAAERLPQGTGRRRARGWPWPGRLAPPHPASRPPALPARPPHPTPPRALDQLVGLVKAGLQQVGARGLAGWHRAGVHAKALGCGRQAVGVDLLQGWVGVGEWSGWAGASAPPRPLAGSAATTGALQARPAPPSPIVHPCALACRWPCTFLTSFSSTSDAGRASRPSRCWEKAGAGESGSASGAASSAAGRQHPPACPGNPPNPPCSCLVVLGQGAVDGGHLPRHRRCRLQQGMRLFHACLKQIGCGGLAGGRSCQGAPKDAVGACRVDGVQHAWGKAGKARLGAGNALPTTPPSRSHAADGCRPLPPTLPDPVAAHLGSGPPPARCGRAWRGPGGRAPF